MHAGALCALHDITRLNGVSRDTDSADAASTTDTDNNTDIATDTADTVVVHHHWCVIEEHETDDDRINYCCVDDVHNDDTSTSGFHSATAYAKLLHTAGHDGIADTNTDLPDAGRNGDAAKQLTETAETVENPNLLNLLIVTEGFTQRPATC